jgi:hypothetical protein
MSKLIDDHIFIPAGCRIKVTSNDNWNENIKKNYISGLTVNEVRFFIKLFKIFEKNLNDSFDEEKKIKRKLNKLLKNAIISDQWKNILKSQDDFNYFLNTVIGEPNLFFYRKVINVEIFCVDSDVNLQFNNITKEFNEYETEPF